MGRSWFWPVVIVLSVCAFGTWGRDCARWYAEPHKGDTNER